VLLAMPWRIWLRHVSPGARSPKEEVGGDIPHRAELAEEVEEFFWSDVEAQVLDE
jgi:hypothetical protein